MRSSHIRRKRTRSPRMAYFPIKHQLIKTDEPAIWDFPLHRCKKAVKRRMKDFVHLKLLL